MLTLQNVTDVIGCYLQQILQMEFSRWGQNILRGICGILLQRLTTLLSPRRTVCTVNITFLKSNILYVFTQPSNKLLKSWQQISTKSIM